MGHSAGSLRLRFWSRLWGGGILLHGLHRDTAFRPQQGIFFSQGDDNRGGHSHFLRGATDIFDNSAILAHVTSPEHLAMAVAFLAASQLVVGLIVCRICRYQAHMTREAERLLGVHRRF